MNFPPTRATQEILPNGLTLILDPDDSAPVVSVQLWVETGSIHEGALLGGGVSHLLEHMVFKGTRSFTNEELASTVQGAGGHWNAYTSFDRTVYYIDGPSDGLETFLRVVSELVFFPTLPEEDFEREKDVIRREIEMGLDDPDDVGHRLLFETAYQVDARRLPVIGRRRLFDHVTHADMCGYHAARYTPERAALVVSGRIDPERVRDLAAELTAEVVGGFPVAPVVAVEPEVVAPRFGRGTFAIPLSKVMLAWPSPPLGHPDASALDLAAAILGRGRAARLYRRLREDRGLATHIAASNWCVAYGPGLFNIGAETPPENREELIAAVHQEIAQLASDDLDAELTKAKRMILSSQLRTLVTASGRASDLGSNWHEARNLDFTRGYLMRLEETTAADVRRALARWITPHTLTTAILDPKDAPAPATLATTRATAGGVHSATLSNGLSVAVRPSDRVPLVSIHAAIRSGLASESTATAGLNTLLAAVLPKGSAHRDAATLATTLENLGATLSATAGNNALLVQADCLAEDFPAVLEIFCEILSSPRFCADAIDRERAAQLAAIHEELEDPMSLAFQALRQRVFLATGYGLPRLGDPASLAALDRDALLAHHQRHTAASNMAVTIFGSVDPKEALDLLEHGLGGLPAGERFGAPPQPLDPGVALRLTLEKQQAVLALGFPACGATGDDRFALHLLREFCADMSGPIFTRIREELGLAYTVGATQFLGFDTGLFTFYLGTSPDQVDFAHRELCSEIALLAETRLTHDAFERTRTALLSSLALQNQSNASMARACALDIILGLGPDHHLTIEDHFKAVSLDDVRQVATRLFAQPHTSIIVAPPSAPPA